MLAKHVVAAIAVGLAAVGCSVLNPSTPTPLPMSVQVQTWYSGTKPRFEEMVAAGNALAQANENEDLAAVNSSCRQLHDAAANMQAHMPTPHPELTQTLQAAISDYDAGTHFCMAGTQSLDPDELSQSVTFLNSANSLMNAAVAIVHRDIGTIGG